MTAQTNLAPGITDKKRRRPYVWVTWITKLLAGEHRCQWAAWYKAHFKHEKTADDGDRADFFAKYTAKHDAIMAERVEVLREAGWSVRVEDENDFKLEGMNGTLSGKPDAVALRDTDGLVLEGKSGKKRQSDHWQVLVYLFALPLTWLKGHTLRGQVEYADGSENVRDLRDEDRDHIAHILKMATGPETPPRTPTKWECEYCDIAACPDRFKERPAGDGKAYF
jgi:hypothetical protein